LAAVGKEEAGSRIKSGMTHHVIATLRFPRGGPDGTFVSDALGAVSHGFPGHGGPLASVADVLEVRGGGIGARLVCTTAKGGGIIAHRAAPR
jgi:hypothetical protein